MTRAPDHEFLEFVKSRAAPLHRMAYLLCGDWHLADDLVQETLAKSFRHWHRVPRAGNPDAYVRRMLINEAAGTGGGTGTPRDRWTSPPGS